jgi:DNA modification methylase
MNSTKPELNKIYCGDTLELMRTWPDAFVQTCITSPPYWGLRDYGTSKWEDGEFDCDHKEAKLNNPNLVALESTDQIRSNPGYEKSYIRYASECPTCHAKKVDSQIGLEPTPEAYVSKMTDVFREVRRVLRDDGTLWLNLGDSYAGGGRGWEWAKEGGIQAGNRGMVGVMPSEIPRGLKAKDLVGIPWRVAFALQSDGWYLRSDIIWAKPNPMPESVTDRPTKAHEYLFLLTKNDRYYYDADAIKEKSAEGRDWTQSGGNLVGTGLHKRNDGYVDLDTGTKYKSKEQYGGGGTSFVGHSGNTKADRTPISCDYRNKRSVWTIATLPYSEAHFATFPPDLIKPCVLSGCPEGGVVLDPFMGAGTTALVAITYQRNFIGTELNPNYINIAEERIANELAQGKFAL